MVSLDRADYQTKIGVLGTKTQKQGNKRYNISKFKTGLTDILHHVSVIIEVFQMYVVLFSHKVIIFPCFSLQKNSGRSTVGTQIIQLNWSFGPLVQVEHQLNCITNEIVL